MGTSTMAAMQTVASSVFLNILDLPPMGHGTNLYLPGEV
jgi:hypothetical protein